MWYLRLICYERTCRVAELDPHAEDRDELVRAEVLRHHEAQASVFGRMAAEAQGKVVFSLPHHEAEWQQKRKERHSVRSLCLTMQKRKERHSVWCLPHHAEWQQKKNSMERQCSLSHSLIRQ